MPAPLAIVIPVAFNEAIRAAERRRVELPDAYYGELQAQARSQAFTIAGAASAAQLRAVLDALNEGLRSGMTFGEWRSLAVEEGLGGLSEARLDLVLRAHTQTAYNAGAWEQVDRVKDRRGFLMYSAINDSRTRPSHRAMDGIIKPVDDTFWDDHSPPCGYNCRCGVISLTEEQAQDRGGVTSTIPTDARADPGWGAKPVMRAASADEAMMRAAIDLPEPIQQQVLDFHREILEERMPERVRDYLGAFAYDTMARDLRPFLIDNAGLIPEHEAVALRAYTGDWYGVMNRLLRGQLSRAERNLTMTIAAATAAVKKLPAFEGRVFRGVNFDRIPNAPQFSRAHVPGEIVEYQAFTSASYEAGFHGNVQYIIHARNGRVVEDLAAVDDEFEVLFAPGTKFRVVASDFTTEPITIELEELADQSITVPESHKFGKPRKRPNADAALTRSQSEIGANDPAAMARFKAAHGGLTPIQYAMSISPSARIEVEQDFPHLCPPKK